MVNKGTKKSVEGGRRGRRGNAKRNRKPLPASHASSAQLDEQLQAPQADDEASHRGGAAENSEVKREFFRVLSTLRWSVICVGNSQFRRIITPESFKRMMVKVNAVVRQHISVDEAPEFLAMLEAEDVAMLIENHHVQHGREAKF